MTTSKKTTYEAYKNLIDDFVKEAHEGGGSPRLAKFNKVVPPFDEDETQYCEFIDSLTDSQKKLLINILRQERIEAFHDLLAQLTYHIDLNGVGMAYNNEPMSVGIEGGLHQDFIGRLNGDWDWPDH